MVIANRTNIPVYAFDCAENFSGMRPTVSSTGHLSDDRLLLHLLQIDKSERFLARTERQFQLKLALKLFIEFRDQIMVSNVNLIWRSQEIVDQELPIGLGAVWKLLMGDQMFASNYSYVFLHVTKVS